MRTTKLRDIVEPAGMVAILIGLLFVYLELKQNGDIAYAELVSGTSDLLDFGSQIELQLGDL